MPLPQQLGDRAAHRVADGDELLDPEDLGEGGDVVGAVGQTERVADRHPAPVASVVEGDDPEVLGERGEGGEPVEVGGGGPAVEEHDGGSTDGSGELPDERATATR